MSQIGQAGVMYMLTQLTKMLFLATFFPMPDAEEEEVALPILNHRRVAAPARGPIKTCCSGSYGAGSTARAPT